MSIEQPLEALNERELEIIPLLAEGLTNKEIADRLFLAPSTVKWYIRQLNSKLDTATREEIVARVDELGLIAVAQNEASYFRPQQNLPRQTTPFIGRDAELDEIHSILENPDVRLLTILAQGGMGKTRIALEASEQQSNRFPDGVYFVGLQALSDITNIVPQIATATGFQFSSDGTEQKAQILNFLSDKKMLLCIDNWEHLLEGATLLNEILTTTPDVKIIATSREKLNLLGETVYILPGMQFPDWETPEDAVEYDAVQLLVQSAKRVKPGWTVTEDNLDYVARICRLTEGMPLGILLATSWLDVYSLERIADEIQNSADILESEMRDIPERQRSIRAVFEYSWEKLRPQEQTILMKMSVFRGGCSLKAVETITDANGRILQSLMNKALLSSNQEGRYDIHELLRQYAEAYLNQSDFADDVRDAHMQYYADAIHERESHLQDSRQLEAVNAISADFENVRVAWLEAIERERFDLIDKIAFPLQIYVNFRTRYEELLDLFKVSSEQMEQSSGNIPPLIQARIETDHARLHWLVGNFKKGEQIAKSILPILHESGDIRSLAHCLRVLGRCLSMQHLHDEAMMAYRECYELCQTVNWEWERAHAAFSIGYLSAVSGDSDQAAQYTSESYQIFQAIGDQFGMMSASHNYATIVLIAQKNDPKVAREHLSRGLEMAGAHDIALQITLLASLLALVELRLNDNLETAEQLAQESLIASQRIAGKSWRSPPYLALSYIALAKDDANGALSLAETAYGLAIEGSNLNQILEAQFLMALAQDLNGNYEDATNKIVEYLRNILGTGRNIADVLPILAMVVAHRGNLIYASELFGRVDKLNTFNDLTFLPGLRTFEAHLRDEIGEDVYQAALERGKSLDIEAVIEEFIARFAEDES